MAEDLMSPTKNVHAGALCTGDCVSVVRLLCISRVFHTFVVFFMRLSCVSRVSVLRQPCVCPASVVRLSCLDGAGTCRLFQHWEEKSELYSTWTRLWQLCWTGVQRQPSPLL